MFELMYASQAVVDLDRREMEALLGVSRTRNQQASITGMLLHVHDRMAGQAFFIQLLEGEQDSVEQTFARIDADELHTGVTVVHRGVVAQPSFPDWQMGLAKMDITVAAELTPMQQHEPSQPGQARGARSTLALLSDAFLTRAMLTLGAEELRQHNRSETDGIIKHADAQTLPTITAFFWRGPDGTLISQG